MYDAIIIGAGVGGLACASKLASKGKKVLVLERMYHLGGSSAVFKREDFTFPMGPLSFSHPDLVKMMLKDVGISEDIQFKRSHFQLHTSDIDIVYSKDWPIFKKELKKKFPEEKRNIDEFFTEFDQVLEAISDIIDWHPNFTVGKKREKVKKNLKNHRTKYEIVETYYKIPSEKLLNKYLHNSTLKNLLGSQGTYAPIMNVVHLAFLWNVMSIQGIWFPYCGTHGIIDLLVKNILNKGGEIRKSKEISEILVENNKAVGVKTTDGRIFKADWVIANADYKQIFLQLIDPKNLSQAFVEQVRDTPYTGSEFCIYLGIDPKKIDLSLFQVDHLFYRAKINELSSDPTDFENKEIEICLWSNKSELFAPKNYKCLVLRVNMPYEYFQDYWIGQFKRKEGYSELKQKLIEKLLGVVEQILPGLSSAIIKIDAGTPLTYRDYLYRFNGSVAGWTRDTKKMRMTINLLTEKPIDHLLMVGIYSFVEPFLGGFPVSMYSGCLAADLVLE